jgi:hypothetical protein
MFPTRLDMFVHFLAIHDTSCKFFTKCENNEQGICNTFCFKIWKTETETYQLLQQAYGEDAVGRKQVFDWFRRFKECRTAVENDPRSERPSTSTNVEMISKVTTICRNNRRLTVRDIADDCGISVCSCDAENERKNGGMATGSYTTAKRRHTVHILCSNFGQTRHRSVAVATILTRSRTVWLFPIPRA